MMSWTLIGCSSKAPSEPKLAAAVSREAQAELRRLEEEWELGSGMKRTELRPELEAFVKKFPFDPSVMRARLLLAQIALMERRLGSAEELLRPLLRGRPGPVRDEAEVVLAAVENRQGKHQQALDRLAPLEGKLLSREARDQYARERIQAAIEVRRWRLTVDAMIAWLAESESARPVKEWTEAAIVQVPTRALSRLVADWEDEESTPKEKEASDWIYRVVIEHLSREALRARDSHLARDLLEKAPPWLRAGPSGDELSVLAALAQEEARILGRSLGVVMGGLTEATQRRSARVGMGMVRGLDLGGGSVGRTPSAIKMQVATNRGSTSAALGTLSGMGASILVAGYDQTGATEAVAFAESRRVPVIVMHEPRPGVRSDFAFVFGVDSEAQLRAVKSVEGSLGMFAVVGEGFEACPSPEARPGTTSLPWSQWKQDGFGSVLVLSDPGCCSRVLSDLESAPWSPRVILGLEGAHLETWGAQQPLRLSVGKYPLPVTSGGSTQMSEAEKALLAGEKAPRLEPGDWYFSLGVDVARLSTLALRSLPEAEVTEKEAVRARHEKARSALLDARAQLLTTDAMGFNSGGRVDREIRILGLEGATP